MFSAHKVVRIQTSFRVSRILMSENGKQHRPLEESCHSRNRLSATSLKNQDVRLKTSLSKPSLVDNETTASLSSVESDPICPTGYLEIIIGPMFSGKTTEILKQIEMAQMAGRKVMAVKSELDTRYSESQNYKAKIVTHSGGSYDSYAVSKLRSLEKLFPEEYREAEVIVIDEAQFFTDIVGFCQKAVDKHGKAVYVAGLDGDFRRKPFKMNPKKPSAILQLVPLADKVSKQQAQCHYCEKPAPFTLRTVPEKQEVLIGGADTYVPVCRAHYLLKWKEFHSESS